MDTSNRYGSLLFCKRCGDLLALPGDDDEIVCDGCGEVEDAKSEQSFHTTAKQQKLYVATLS